jgi:predicted DNA-binding protein
MVRPWVKVSLSQYEKLRKLREETNRPLSEIIREAVSKFVRKKDFPYSVAISCFPKGTKNGYKYISAYLPGCDRSLLEEIAENTGKCKTEVIRQAVDEYPAK